MAKPTQTHPQLDDLNAGLGEAGIPPNYITTKNKLGLLNGGHSVTEIVSAFASFVGHFGGDAYAALVQFNHDGGDSVAQLLLRGQAIQYDEDLVASVVAAAPATKLQSAVFALLAAKGVTAEQVVKALGF